MADDNSNSAAKLCFLLVVCVLGLLVYTLFYVSNLEHRLLEARQESTLINKSVATTLGYYAGQLESLAISIQLHIENDLTEERIRTYNKNYAPRPYVATKTKRKPKAAVGGP